jgi:hypothetical protein
MSAGAFLQQLRPIFNEILFFWIHPCLKGYNWRIPFSQSGLKALKFARDRATKIKIPDFIVLTSDPVEILGLLYIPIHTYVGVCKKNIFFVYLFACRSTKNKKCFKLQTYWRKYSTNPFFVDRPGIKNSDNCFGWFGTIFGGKNWRFSRKLSLRFIFVVFA